MTPHRIRFGSIAGPFTSPIQWAISNGQYKDYGVHVTWHEFPSNDDVSTALAEDVIDIAILPTENFLFEACRFGYIQLFGTYLADHLRWAVYVNAESSYKSISELKGKKFGTRGFMSGSGLRTQIEAHYQGWSDESARFSNTKETSSSATLFSWLDEKVVDALLLDHLEGRARVASGKWRIVHQRLADWPTYVFAVAASAPVEKFRLDADLSKAFTHVDTEETQHQLEEFHKQVKAAGTFIKSPRESVSNTPALKSPAPSSAQVTPAQAPLSSQPDTRGLTLPLSMAGPSGASAESLHAFMFVTDKVSRLFSQNINEESTKFLMTRYHLEKEVAEYWLQEAKFAASASFPAVALKNALIQMNLSGIVDKTPPLRGLFHPTTRVNLPLSDSSEYDWKIHGVKNALRLMGKSDPSTKLSVDMLGSLGHLEHYHYLGRKSCDNVARTLGFDLGPKKNGEPLRVLDAGCGIGGPVRHWTGKYKVHVTGVDVQPVMVKLANELTSRCEDVDKNLFEFLEFDLNKIGKGTHIIATCEKEKFDAITIQQTLQHLDNRQESLSGLRNELVDGGMICSEDFVLLKPWEEIPIHVKKALDKVLNCKTISNIDDLVADFEKAGFVDAVTVDLTERWTRWTVTRHEDLRARFDDVKETLGEELAEERRFFYRATREMFEKGYLGGFRVSARKNRSAGGQELVDRLEEGRFNQKAFITANVKDDSAIENIKSASLHLL
eukprot:GDKJ01019622.1.p1 GENE.GDKJ01019622.1~~GDKJ01019622.1.p1  ORF type:complete len:725 (-),score=189.22 GDKJ01019622.1:927-3101(-)